MNANSGSQKKPLKLARAKLPRFMKMGWDSGWAADGGPGAEGRRLAAASGAVTQKAKTKMAVGQKYVPKMNGLPW